MNVFFHKSCFANRSISICQKLVLEKLPSCPKNLSNTPSQHTVYALKSKIKIWVSEVCTTFGTLALTLPPFCQGLFYATLSTSIYGILFLASMCRTETCLRCLKYNGLWRLRNADSEVWPFRFHQLRVEDGGWLDHLFAGSNWHVPRENRP